MKTMQYVRSVPTTFKTRENGEDYTIEGYFAVFDSNYDIAPGLTESIAPGAFDNTIGDDVRALVNHDTTLVLGRTSAHTLELAQDDKGLWGKITINPNDGDAMNLYERVKRGDVNQCSFGFDIVREDAEYLDDDRVHWTIEEVKLYEVSPVTFPAYQDTHVDARSADAESIKARKAEAWRKRMEDKINGVESTDAPQEN